MAARREAAAGKRLAGVRRRAGNRLAQRARPADVREAREQPLGVRVLGRREDVAHGTLLGDLPGVHDRDAVARLGDHREVVRDQQQREPEIAPQLLEQLQDLPLRHHVERRRGLVADDQLGPAGQRERDHHALPHAAGELVRVLLAPRRRDADALEQLGDARVGIAAGSVQDDRLGDLPVDPHDRVERVHRALEDHRRGLPAHVAPARRRATVQQHHAALGVDRHLAADAAQPAREQTEQRERRGGLAAAGLAGQTERLAAAQLEADAVDDRDDAALLAVGHAQVAHVEQRVALDGRRAHARSRRVGLTISSSA